MNHVTASMGIIVGPCYRLPLRSRLAKRRSVINLLYYNIDEVIWKNTPIRTVEISRSSTISVNGIGSSL